MHPLVFVFPDWLPLLGGRPLYAYGVLFGFSLIAGWAFTARNARKAGIPPRVTTWALVLTCIGGILGARVLFLMVNPDAWQGPVSLLRLDSGGLVAYGGFLGGALLAATYVVLVGKRSFLDMADHAAPAIFLGVGLTRLGCTLFGCDYGAPSSGPLAMRFPMWSGETALAMGQRIAGFSTTFKAKPRLCMITSRCRSTR
jgi:phosphatidylglycerol:prolipoprotein diacylglycerol transferase